MDEEKRFQPIREDQHRAADFACRTVKSHSVMWIVNSLVITVLIPLLSSGCSTGSASKDNAMIFKTAEDARAYVEATKITGDRFELPIANEFTFGGRPDTMGAGMAVVVDAILAQRYEPDGFEQREGYRLYRYKPWK
jgi:hypothetical protein